MRLGNPTLYKPWFRSIVAIAGLSVFGVFGLIGFATNSSESYTLVNSLFAILLALAAVCFSFARTALDQATADRVMFAGERLLHACILFATTTLLKYVVFRLAGSPESVGDLHLAVAIPVGLFLAFCSAIFIYGITFATTGVRVISDVLIERMFRHDDWDDIA
jgi:hypothetical protein